MIFNPNLQKRMRVSVILFFCRVQKKGDIMSNYLFISDAAKEVNVESHVLRYWEEELHLPIKRNELGHRYYTKEDVERFKTIKGMKERGLQLKAIKMILKDGKLDLLSNQTLSLPEGPGKMGKSAADQGKPADSAADQGKEMLPDEEFETSALPAAQTEELQAEAVHTEVVHSEERGEGLQPQTGSPQGKEQLQAQEEERFSEGLAVGVVARENAIPAESKEEKSKRLQWLLQQLIRETLQENNQEICREIKESVVKELDYQFRMQEEREEVRDKIMQERDEEHYKRMDELLRKKTRKGFGLGKKDMSLSKKNKGTT